MTDNLRVSLWLAVLLLAGCAEPITIDEQIVRLKKCEEAGYAPRVKYDGYGDIRGVDCTDRPLISAQGAHP